MLCCLVLWGTHATCSKKVNPQEDTVLEDTDTDPVNTDTADEFMIAIIGDTQYYTDNTGINGQYIQGFKDQIDWIKKNRVDSNIVYVMGVGDVVDHGDHGKTVTGIDDSEWLLAKEVYYELENVPGLPEGIPYGIGLGNHDTTPYGHNEIVRDKNVPVEAKFYNQYFGREHFQGRSYYGGSMSTANNDNHYGFFSGGGMDFVVIYLQFDQFNRNWENMNNWAASILAAHPDKKGIIMTHHTINAVDNFRSPDRERTKDGKEDFSEQAEDIYNRLKTYPNFFMMIGGHVAGEGRRQDVYLGNMVRSFTVDYQGCRYPAGLLRTLKFSKSKDLIYARTFLPKGGNCMKTTTEERCVGEGGISHYNCQDTRSTFTVPWFGSVTAARTHDFNNDGKSEPVFFSNGIWKIQGQPDVSFDSQSDIPLPGDYNRDGKADLAVYNPSNGQWAVRGQGRTSFQVSGAVPVPGDYDGNGTADFAFFELATATWHVYQRYLDENIVQQHGKAGDIPVPADYDGDGRVDYAVFSPSTAEWSIFNGSAAVFGKAGDIPVPGDYNGDGITEQSVYRPSTGEWIVKGTTNAVQIGQIGDIPVPGDYDGDGKTDIAVYRPSDGKVYIHGQTTIDTGHKNAKPLNLPYAVRRVFFP